MVNIVAVRHLKSFIEDNPQYKTAIEAWISIVKSCNWEKPQDIVKEFGTKAVDILRKKNNKKGTVSSNRVVIDIKGNYIRIIAKYQFHPNLKKAHLYLKWIGTHADYDKLNDQNKQYEVDMFKS